VQECRGQRDAARPAHEEDGRQLRRGEARGRDGQQRGGDGAVEDRPGQLLELLAAERDAVVDERHVYVRGGGAAECLLGLPGVLPQLPGGAAVGVVGGLGEPAPLVGRPAGELTAEVADDRRVDVEAARVGEPLGRENVEAAGGGAPHDGRVEGAGTEVVDDGRAADR